MSWMILKSKIIRHADFLLLMTLFLFFRLCSALLFRPGGYIRDYSDLIYYHRRASWQDFGLLPYRDYWSEYPPLFAWFSVWVDRVSRQIPLWEDERLWYAVIFGLCTVAAEVVTFFCLYQLARRIYGDGALRVNWLYAGLFLPVYMLGGWFDALPVATIFLALWLLLEWPHLIGMAVAGIVLGLGGLLKLTPLALLAILPLLQKKVWQWLFTGGLAGVVMVTGYLLAYRQGPQMTLASLRSLLERSGWATLYAWTSGYTRLGKVLGDVFDPAEQMSLYTTPYSQRLIFGAWLLLGVCLLLVVWRQSAVPQPAYQVVGFAAATYALLLLAYPAWNPQYALYLLPFLILLWPNWRGTGYALALSMLVLIEHPIYHNLLGPDYPPAFSRLIDVDYKYLFFVIILARTAVLFAIALDLTMSLVRLPRRVRWAPVGLACAALLAIFVTTTQFAKAYVAGRLASSSVRPLALYLNSNADDMPIVSQRLRLERELRPFLRNADRLTLIAGRPGQLDPLPAIAAQGPFLYIRTREDDPALVGFIEQTYPCAVRSMLNDWEVWGCNGVNSNPVATFEQDIQLTGFTLTAQTQSLLYLTLFWQTEQLLTTDYTVFVHVVDHNGKMIGQWDQMPQEGNAPTTSWTVNRVVVDDYLVPLKLDEAVKPYRLLVGLYDAQTGTRLNVISTAHTVNDARVELYVFSGE